MGEREVRGSVENRGSYVRSFFFGIAGENVPEDIDGCFWLDGDASLHSILVNIADQFLG